MIPVVPFTLVFSVFSAVVGCGHRSGRGPPAGLRGRSATWGTGAGGENFMYSALTAALEKFSIPGSAR
jgi:hypothetical protein